MAARNGLAGLLLLLLGASASAATDDIDFRRGLSAFNRGEYAEAFSAWSAAERAGDLNAQSGLGYLYFKGMGVAQNRELAARIYTRAAERGQPEAQLFLGAIYLYGEGLPRDYVKAYAWCDIAQANGASGALECRDMAARKMSDAEIAASNALISKWHREHDQNSSR